MRRQIVHVAILLATFVVAAHGASSAPEPAFLWVVDQSTGLGVPVASVDIGPEKNCVGATDTSNVRWTAHYVTGPAGRVASETYYDWFSCRVTLNGKQLEVVSAGPMKARPWPGPKWLALQHASEMSLTVELSKPDVTQDDLHYWEHTSDPAEFRAYIEDVDTGQLLSNVTITALHSGISTTSDDNGLFSLGIPARSRKGVSPPGAMETLVFTKPGYRRYEYRNLVLQPGLNWLVIYIEIGTGTVVRKNLAAHNGGEAEFLDLKDGEREATRDRKGEIISLNIEPATFEGGWIVCTERGAKAIVKARNLKSVDIFWYSTGTGIGEMPPAKAGPMKKVGSSADGDIWEIEMPDLMATNFWAQGTDLSGNVIRSMDLGNVGWDVNP